jgi:hypothetical protein
VAEVEVSTTPNPDALKFTVGVALPAMINVSSPAAATTAFERDVMALEGVANLFGVNDFVTITRVPGADWDPIIAGVRRAAAEHL